MKTNLKVISNVGSRPSGDSSQIASLVHLVASAPYMNVVLSEGTRKRLQIADPDGGVTALLQLQDVVDVRNVAVCYILTCRVLSLLMSCTKSILVVVESLA